MSLINTYDVHEVVSTRRICMQVEELMGRSRKLCIRFGDEMSSSSKNGLEEKS